MILSKDLIIVDPNTLDLSLSQDLLDHIRKDYSVYLNTGNLQERKPCVVIEKKIVWGIPYYNFYGIFDIADPSYGKYTLSEFCDILEQRILTTTQMSQIQVSYEVNPELFDLPTGTVRGQQMILGVAVKIGDLMIALPRPKRHSDCIEMLQSLGISNDYLTTPGWSKNQGFYTDEAKYLTRPEAFKHAVRCGQLVIPDLHDFSELDTEHYSGHGIVSEMLWNDDNTDRNYLDYNI